MKRKLLFAMLCAVLGFGTANAENAYQNYLTTAKGWTQVTDLSSLTLDNYYFAIVSSNNTDLMVKMAQAKSGQQASNHSMWYMDAKDPLKDNSYLWTLEANNTEGYEGYTIRNVDRPVRVIQTNEGQPWYARTNWETSSARWTSYAFNLSDGKYSIQALANGGTNYLGLWVYDNGYKSGEELAGNKSGEQIGSFLLYSIPKTTADAAIATADGASSSAPYDLAPSLFGRYTSDYTGATGYYGDYRYLEKYNDDATPSTGDKVTKTITNAPNGMHKITVIANAAWISGRGSVGTTTPTVNDNSTVVSINGVSQNVPVRTDGSYNPVTLTFNTCVTDGNITFKITNNDAAAFWFVWDVTDEYIGDECTSLITNPSFETGDATGWTNSGMAFQNNSSFAKTGTYYAESWQPNGTKSITQTLSSLPAGLYTLTAHAKARGVTSAKISAAGIDKAITVADSDNDYSIDFAADGSSDVTIGFEGVGTGASSSWLCVDNFTLTYNGTEFPESLTGVEGTMYTGAATAQTAAISAYAESQTVSTYNTAKNAIYTAEASIAAYASISSDNISAYKTKIGDVLENTNVYTSDAYNKWYANVETNYTSGVYTDAEVALLTESGAYSTGWHSANHIDDILLSTWKVEDVQCEDYTQSLYINTWSTEGNTDGSEFYTPFFEYFIADASSLGAKTFTSTVTGLTAESTYSVSIRARVRQTNDKTKIANGITMQVGSGDAVDISSGDQFDGGQFYIGNFSAVGQTDADGNLVTTITVADASNISWLSFYNLKYQDMSALVAAFEAKQTEATGLLANATYTNVTGSERTTLTNAKNATPSSFDEYTAANTTLQNAIDAFKAAVTNYNLLATEIAKATALGVSSETIATYQATSESTAASVLTNIQGLKVAEYTYVTDTYKYGVELGTWTASEGTGTMTGQHWDGTTESSYLEQSSASWAASSWDISYDQNILLPAGNYVFKVAGRTANSTNVSMSLTVKNGDDVIGTVADFPKGDTGYGINTSGATDYDSESTYANTTGRGWEWRYVKFTLADPATVNVAVTASATAKNMWVGFCNATVQTDNADNVALMTALVALNNARTAATLTRNANHGTNVFQLAEETENTLWSAYSTAKTNADNFALDAESTVDEVNALTTALTTAQTNYANNQVLNVPDAEKRYKLNLANKGILTYITNGETDGGYGMPFKAEGDYMAQSFTFTNVEGNNYKLSFVDFNGDTRYICTKQTGYGEGGSGTAGIRTTTDASKALTITIQATSTEYVFNMLNTEHDNAKLGATDDGDLYTDNTNTSWGIDEASQASVTVSAKAGKFGTVIFPFTPDVSEGFDDITFYSCASINSETNNVLLESVATPAANVPYLIKNDGGENFSKELTGWGTAAADAYTVGLLTGVYEADDIEASVEPGAETEGAYRYILQTQDGVQAFYKVSDYSFKATAYKAYLTVSVAATGGEAKAFYLDFGGADAIKSVETDNMKDATIFNLAGQRVNKAQKGIYIVNGKKVLAPF